MKDKELIEDVVGEIILDIHSKSKKCYDYYIQHDVMSDFNVYLIDNLTINKWKKLMQELLKLKNDEVKAFLEKKLLQKREELDKAESNNRKNMMVLFSGQVGILEDILKKLGGEK